MPEASTETDFGSWQVIRTRPQHEFCAFSNLATLFEPYLPVYTTILKPKPLFPGYLFCRFDYVAHRNDVLRTPGVLDILKFRNGATLEPAQVSQAEINQIRELERSGAVPYDGRLNLDDLVEVKVGSGTMYGVVKQIGSDLRIIVSVEILGRLASLNFSARDVRRVA